MKACPICKEPLRPRQKTCSDKCRKALSRGRNDAARIMGLRVRVPGRGAEAPGQSVDADEATSHLVTLQPPGHTSVTPEQLYRALLRELETHAARGGTPYGYFRVMKRVAQDLGVDVGFGRLPREPIGTYAERVRKTGPKAGLKLMTRPLPGANAQR